MACRRRSRCRRRTSPQDRTRRDCRHSTMPAGSWRRAWIDACRFGPASAIIERCPGQSSIRASIAGNTPHQAVAVNRMSQAARAGAHGCHRSRKAMSRWRDNRCDKASISSWRSAVAPPAERDSVRKTPGSGGLPRPYVVCLGASFGITAVMRRMIWRSIRSSCRWVWRASSRRDSRLHVEPRCPSPPCQP